LKVETSSDSIKEENAQDKLYKIVGYHSKRRIWQNQLSWSIYNSGGNWRNLQFQKR